MHMQQLSQEGIQLPHIHLQPTFVCLLLCYFTVSPGFLHFFCFSLGHCRFLPLYVSLLLRSCFCFWRFHSLGRSLFHRYLWPCRSLFGLLLWLGKSLSPWYPNYLIVIFFYQLQITILAPCLFFLHNIVGDCCSLTVKLITQKLLSKQ